METTYVCYFFCSCIKGDLLLEQALNVFIFAHFSPVCVSFALSLSNCAVFLLFLTN